MRFYLDEDLSVRIAVIARERGVDVLSSHECGNDGRSDDEQLRFAAGEGRCLVTRNRDHFVRLTVRFFENEWPHAGVLIVPRSLANDDFAGIGASLQVYHRRHGEGVSSYTVDFLAASVDR